MQTSQHLRQKLQRRKEQILLGWFISPTFPFTPLVKIPTQMSWKSSTGKSQSLKYMQLEKKYMKSFLWIFPSPLSSVRA